MGTVLFLVTVKVKPVPPIGREMVVLKLEEERVLDLLLPKMDAVPHCSHSQFASILFAEIPLSNVDRLLFVLATSGVARGGPKTIYAGIGLSRVVVVDVPADEIDVIPDARTYEVGEQVLYVGSSPGAMQPLGANPQHPTG